MVSLPPFQVAGELFEILLTEAAQTVQGQGRLMAAEVPLLQSLNTHLTALCHLLLQVCPQHSRPTICTNAGRVNRVDNLILY